MDASAVLAERGRTLSYFKDGLTSVILDKKKGLNTILRISTVCLDITHGKREPKILFAFTEDHSGATRGDTPLGKTYTL